MVILPLISVYSAFFIGTIIRQLKPTCKEKDVKQNCFCFRGQVPSLAPSVFTAPGARLVGDVRVGENSSIWFNAVLRGDIAPIVIGAGSNIQDNCVLHVDRSRGCIVGDRVLIGHGAICHACVIGNGALIGMGAIVLSGAKIGEEALIAAGALIKENTIVPPRTLWAGNPAIQVRTLGPGILERMRGGTSLYSELAESFLEQDETSE